MDSSSVSHTHNPQKNIRMSEFLYKDADIVAKIVITLIMFIV
jgi:hypothetical protein